MQERLLAAIRDQLLSEPNVARSESKLVRRLGRPAANAPRVRKLETEIGNITYTIALGIRSQLSGVWHLA